MPVHIDNSLFKSIEFFRFFTGIFFSVSLLFLTPTVASAETRSFAFWRGVEVIDVIKEQAQKYELVLKKLADGSETTLYSFNHFAMLADAGISSSSAQLNFGRIQASPEGFDMIIGYGVKEPADNMKLARIEKLSLQDGSRSTIKEWNLNSPAGSFNYDFEPLTVDWSNQKIYFFKTNEIDKSKDSLVSLSFNGGEVNLLQEIQGSPETIQLAPQNQDVMVMGEDIFERGDIYVFDKNGHPSIVKKTKTIPDEHTFSFSASGNEILYLNAPDRGNPSLMSKSISYDSESTRFDYVNLNPGSWSPLASNGDFKDIETFYNEDSSGKIAFVAESLGEYAELVELDVNSGLTTILSTGVVQVPEKVDSYEDGWLVNFSGTPVPQSQPSSISVPNASGVYIPVPTPIIPQASSLIANAGPVSDGGHWKQSSWLGYFWEKPNSSWIFHPVLGWLHLIPNDDDSFWVYTQDLFPIPIWLWIQPIQFPYVYAKAASSSGRRVWEMDGITTTWSNKILSNNYIEWNLGSDWSSTILIDSDYGTTNLLFNASTANYLHSVGLSILYEEPSYSLGNPYDTYLWDSNDHNVTIATAKNSDMNQLVLNERFLTASGHQAVGVHLKQTLPTGVNDLFTFLIDGSTTGFPQPVGTWMKVQLKITATSFAGGMTIEEAKSIVNKLEFIGGTPDPKGEIEQYQNLTPDSSNTQPPAASGSSNVVASVPITPDPVTSGGNEPDFVNGAWLYLDLDKGSLTHWDNQNNQWVDWSKIAKPNLIGTSSSTSVSEKYQGMEFSKAVESIMNSSKSDEEKKEDLGAYILGF